MVKRCLTCCDTGPRFFQRTTYLIASYDSLRDHLIISLSREGSLPCHTCCDTGSRFFQSHPKDRLCRLARGWRGSILIRTLTGPHFFQSHQKDRLFRLARGCRGPPILIRILIGPHSVRCKYKATMQLFIQIDAHVRV
jgi:hypothetical protein